MKSQFEIKDIFSECFIFQGFTDEDYAVVETSVSWREYQVGEYFFHEGDACDGFFLICCGKVEIVREKSDKVVEESLASLKGGEIFGEIALFLPEGKRSASARGEEPGTCCFFPQKSFEQLLKQDHRVAHKIILAMARTLSERLDSMTKRSLQLSEQECPSNANGVNRDLVKFKDQLASLWSF